MIERNFAKKLVDDYVVFDLETTGFNPKEDRIIEIGAIKYRNNLMVDEFNILVDPECLIPENITAITGITNKMVKGKTKIKQAILEFLIFIEDLTLIAHNSSFDLSFIEENIKRLGLEMITNQNIDTVYLARKYIRQLPNVKLETLKRYFKLDYASHRSIEDVKTTNYVYQYCKDKSLIKN